MAESSVRPVEPGPEKTVTIVTGLEGVVQSAEPVTCSYCDNKIVTGDDHSTICPWKRGKTPAR
ncbi:hypothetical protein [Streptomyces mayteni]